MTDDLILPRGRKRTKRIALMHEYGPKLVRDAEHDALIAILMAKRVVDYDELLGVAEQRLKEEDQQRQREAGY